MALAKPAGTAKSRTIERAALVLTCFSAATPHLSLPQLAEKLDLNQTTVYRYVITLQSAGLLERDERYGGYRLGLRVVELAHLALNQLDVRREALEEMDDLRDKLQALVNLAVLFGGDVVHVAHSRVRDSPLWQATPGRRAVAHCTALGKVLLAYRPWEEVVHTIEEHGWRPYTPNSIRDFDRLHAELEGIRRDGYSLDNEERGIGIVCLAVPIFDVSGKAAAAISTTDSVPQFTPDMRARVLPLLLETSRRISRRLGNVSGGDGGE